MGKCCETLKFKGLCVWTNVEKQRWKSVKKSWRIVEKLFDVGEDQRIFFLFPIFYKKVEKPILSTCGKVGNNEFFNHFFRVFHSYRKNSFQQPRTLIFRGTYEAGEENQALFHTLFHTIVENCWKAVGKYKNPSVSLVERWILSHSVDGCIMS